MIKVIITIICLIPFILGIFIVIGLFIKFMTKDDREINITFEIKRQEDKG